MAGTLAELVDELCELHRLRSWHESQRLRTEITTVHAQMEQGASVAAAQREADFWSLEDRLAVVDLDAKIASLELRARLAEREEK